MFQYRSNYLLRNAESKYFTEGGYAPHSFALYNEFEVALGAGTKYYREIHDAG